MTIQNSIGLVIVDTLGGTIKNLPFFILIYMGFKIVSKSITNGTEKLIKELPKWLEQWDKIKMKHYLIDKAVQVRNR